jgi:serine/threonine-protein kinase
MAGGRFCHQCGAPVPATEGATDAFIGKVIGSYRVLSVIGEGGMGKVYRAEQVKLQRPVCIKTLLPHLAADESLVQRFEREGVATAAMRHPNVVAVIDFGRTDDGTLYIVMEYVEGKTLRAVLKEESPLAADRALTITEQILSGLHEAHSHNVVHRDLKPSNVLVSRLSDGHDLVKVVDFGIAKIVGEDAQGQQQLTRTGLMVGTPGYMAPEQILGDVVEGAADVYAAGVILWELLVGQKLFGKLSENELSRKHVMQPAPSPSSVSRVPISPMLDEVVLKALEKRPERRYRTALEFRRALEAVHAALKSGSSAPSLSPPTPMAVSAATAPRPEGLSNLAGAVPDKLLAYAAALPSAALAREKRAVTVLFAEVLGQATLNGAMEAQAIRATLGELMGQLAAVLTGLEAASERFLGTCVVGVFGVTVAHEDDAARAVRAAVEMTRVVAALNQRLPRPLSLKVGLHSQVVADAGGEGPLLESPGVSEVLAVARQLASSARADRPLASRTVQRAALAVAAWTERASISDDSGGTWEVQGLVAAVAVQREAFSGRSQELKTLQALLEHVKGGRRGGLLVLGGAGLGKSRLLDEAQHLARERKMLVARARAGRFGDRATFDVVRQLVHSLSVGDNVRDELDVSRTTLAGLTRLGVARPDIARLEGLFGTSSAESGGATREDQQSLDRAALLALFQATSKKQPLLLLIDDAHLADGASLELLGLLVGQTGQGALGVLAAARPVETDTLLPQVRRMELGPLTPTELLDLIKQRLPSGSASRELAQMVSARCDGNPLFAREVLGALVESGAAQLVQGEWRLSTTAPELPDSLQALLFARLDRLSPQARLLLRFGAVAGRTFPIELVAAAVDAPLDLQAASAECVQRGVLAPAELHGGSLQFTQVLLHEAVVQRLAPTDRRAIHARLAEALERGLSAGAENALEAMARHAVAAEQPRKAVKYLKLSGDRLLERHAPAAAAEAFALCLQLLRAEAVKLGPVSEGTAQSMLEVAAANAQALSLTTPARVVPLVDGVLAEVPAARAPARRAEVLRQRGLALQKLSRLPDAEKDLSEALKLVPPGAENATLTAALRADLASVLEAKGDFGGASKLLVDGLSLIGNKKLEDRHLLWQYLNQLGRLHLRMGQLPKAGEFFESARNQARTAESPLGESKVLTNQAVMAAQQKDLGQAMRLFDEAKELAEQAGDRIGVLRIRYNRARVLLGGPRAGEAQTELMQVAEGARLIGWREGEALATQAGVQKS